MIVEIVLGLVVLAEGYVIWNLTRKTELLETWIEDFSDRITQVQQELNDIDSTGHFESDDEIGSIFDSIKEVINDLNNFTEQERKQVSKTATPVKKKKKKTKHYYFNIGTEKAIIRYNKTDDARLKNKIYSEHISYPFDKLAENIIHTFKFYYFDVPSEQVKHEVVSFLVMNMHKFKEGKGKGLFIF